MNNIIFIVLLFCCQQLVAQGFENVSEVPNPKQKGSFYVSNPDDILGKQTELEINGILAKIEEQDSFQVALVCLNSINDNVPKDFATDLFNHWKLGLVNKDNGLLVLFVKDQRRIEFETGDGTEAVLTDYQCTQIIDDYMIYDFKNGDYDQGLLHGMNAIANHLAGKTVDSYTNQSANADGSYDNSVYSTPFYRKPRFWFIIIGWQLVFIIAFITALIFIRLQFDPYKKYGIIRYFNVGIYVVLFPLSYLILYKLIKGLKERYRNMIRFSGKTGNIMHKLSETEEDKYLTGGQITEEIVRSVDYDVWLEDSISDTLILAYRPFLTNYSKCPKCGYTTYIKDYDRQLVAPTTSSAGSGERKSSCRNCNYENIQQYTIPRIVRTSTTSSSRGWSSSGSSSGGWSGGGSWGGGHSSGGGGGRSW